MERCCDAAPLRELLLELMARPGRACYDPARAKWPPMIRQLSAALGASRAAAVQAACLVELTIGALDVFDDVIDGELPGHLSSGRAINAGIALLALLDAALEPLAETLGPARAGLMRRCVWQAVARATSGEDDDIRFEQEPLVDEQQALDMTARKSGSLVAMAFELAGLLHTDDGELLAALVDFGSRVGVISQLDNDLQSCRAGAALSSSDLRLRKKTLPVAYALQVAQDEGRADFLRYFAEPQPAPDRARLEEIQRFVASSGGLHYAWVVCEAVRQDAETKAGELAPKFGDGLAEALRGLIPPLPAMIDRA